ncbi:TPR end-of-group domain-containing protein [Tautonia plasticadhaerens]|uniref:Tetratricopeptide repeat protein n=1 Tax=Tautonia plasticadhaerens TaxID=2527974 RepID=A0A518H571_9BACT|nr:tetratricopeptide repeat protein [Tautonia plasticadhaerens]QDV35986.1 Tetratricopeptide repeat protein [Tautonia plasticadhaerens]
MPTTAISDPTIRRLREAEGFLELGMPGHALEILRARRDWATVQFEASYLTGEALRELGQFREALAPLEVAARLRPDNVHVAIAQGWCYKRTHRLAQAVDALERARRSHPDDPMIRYNLACYWSLAGDPGRCLEQLSAALGLEPMLRSLIAGEADFDAVRHLSEFDRLADEHPSGA